MQSLHKTVLRIMSSSQDNPPYAPLKKKGRNFNAVRTGWDSLVITCCSGYAKLVIFGNAILQSFQCSLTTGDLIWSNTFLDLRKHFFLSPSFISEAASLGKGWLSALGMVYPHWWKDIWICNFSRPWRKHCKLNGLNVSINIHSTDTCSLSWFRGRVYFQINSIY